MDYPQYIAARQFTDPTEGSIIMGRNSDALDSFFTQRIDNDGNQTLGHYDMTLGQAYTDYEERLVTK